MSQSSDQLELIPPYCPNPLCRFHLGTDFKFYVKNGFTKTEKAPGFNQRYKCKNCCFQFSRNTFSLDFRNRLPGLSKNVLDFTMNGMSNNSVAKLLKVAEPTIRKRLRVIANQGLIFEKENEPKTINENCAYDGFETFTYSQFSPCYVNTAVGSNSHFIYHNTLSPLNRKGRMTENQKEINRDLILKHGPYPSNSVYEESCYIIQNLSFKAPGKTLYTDEHRAYLRAVRSFDSKLDHVTVNSNERRSASNPLFPINRLHNLYRHFFSSQQRETIAFQKHEAALMEKMQLMKIYRNFMKPKFVKKNKFDSHAHEWSPAMYVGIAEKILSFEEVFGIRKVKSQVRLDSREVAFINREYPYSRRVIVV